MPCQFSISSIFSEENEDAKGDTRRWTGEQENSGAGNRGLHLPAVPVVQGGVLNSESR
jgi:hypothetical protein